MVLVARPPAQVPALMRITSATTAGFGTELARAMASGIGRPGYAFTNAVL
jgi:hypothetical protein